MNTPTPPYRVYRQALAATQLRRIIIGGLLLAIMALATTATATRTYGDGDETWDVVSPPPPRILYLLVAPEIRPTLCRWA
jgi:hypothetical protein